MSRCAYDDSGDQGNQKFRRTGVVQLYTVSGTVELPEGIAFDLSACSGFLDTFTQFANSPASSVFRSEEFNLSCGWLVGDSFIGLFAVVDEFGGFGDLFISTPETEVFGVETFRELTPESFSASYELFAASTEPGPIPPDSEPIGSAEASATLTPTNQRINEFFSFGSEKIHVTGQLYSVDGTLSITSEIGDFTLTMDEESCRAAEQTTTSHFSARQGPRGKPLPNDAPEGALPIAIGETVTVRNTTGNSPEPEAPCTLDFGDEQFDVPIGRSAWWTFEGTGGDVLIDTAGSDFDTVVAVYVEDGAGGFEQLGCIDDVDSLQARITVSTEVGVTYWIQAGGLGDQGGRLVLTVTAV